MTRIVDSFDCQGAKWELDEAKDDKTGIVDGVNILARVQGPMFLVNGASRNNRYYKKSLWEKALNASKSLIESGNMLGTIGHDTALDDKGLQDGRASHRISKLWIDEKQNIGMGEILVLNTSAGRELNGYLRGGVQFPVSSRALGDMSNEKIDGIPCIDEDSYMLEGFDFVRVPGVAQAVPRLVEHLDDEHNRSDTMTGDVTKSVLESLANDKASLQAEVDKMADRAQQLEGRASVAEGKLSIAEEKLTAANESVTELTAKQDELAAKMEEAQKTLESYQKFGTPEEVQALIEASHKVGKKLESLGTLDEMESAINLLEELHDKFGRMEDIQEAFDALAKFEALGTAEEMDEAATLLEQYSEMGDPDTIQQALTVATSYAQLGASVKTMKAALEAYRNQGKNSDDKATAAAVEELAEKFDLASAIVKPVVESMGAEKASKVLADMVESAKMSRFVAKDGEKPKANENQPASDTTRAGRMFESM